MNDITFRIYQMYHMGNLLALNEMFKYDKITKEEHAKGCKLSEEYEEWIYNNVGNVEIETTYNEYV